MSLKKFMTLMLVLLLVLSLLPMAAFAAETTGATEAPAEEEPAKEKEGIPWGVQAALFALAATFLQNKFIHGRRR